MTKKERKELKSIQFLANFYDHATVLALYENKKGLTKRYPCAEISIRLTELLKKKH